jgi:hypothetical protein
MGQDLKPVAQLERNGKIVVMLFDESGHIIRFLRDESFNPPEGVNPKKETEWQ